MGRSIILGAGASRGVSYAEQRSMPSPLDGDFFDLLQRLDTRRRFGSAVSFVIERCLERPEDRLWQSMEQLFYSMYLRATIGDVINDKPSERRRREVIKKFTRALEVLLREAHGKASCDYHKELIVSLSARDAILTFNYDLVVERAIGSVLPGLPAIGGWLYGFKPRPVSTERVPAVYKLHGSSNWIRVGTKFDVRQRSWDEFDDTAGYRAHSSKESPILLPFWDKRIEDEPWSPIWRAAASALKRSSQLLIWGYSLPPTDFKSRELFRLAASSSRLCEVTVIDPSSVVRDRWREIFVRQRFRHYPSYLPR